MTYLQRVGSVHEGSLFMIMLSFTGYTTIRAINLN